jgi:aspartate 1-decarboxylase
MLLHILKSKIHRARITGCDLNYEGSLAVDLDILDRAGILPYERILVVNACNGERLETYAIPAPRGSRTMLLNGAAARRGMAGDVVTVMAFAAVTPAEARRLAPRVLTLDEQNAVVRECKMRRRPA